MVTTTAAYRIISNDLTRALNNTAKKPQAARETAYYLTNIEKVKSIDDFMGDKRLYNYVMKAFGLQDMAYAKAFIRKALEGGVDDPESFANRLSDTRYKDMVATFNFVRHGELTTLRNEMRQQILVAVMHAVEITDRRHAALVARPDVVCAADDLHATSATR